MKILVVFTGGTIGSSSEAGIISPNIEQKRTLINNFENKSNFVFEEAEPYFALSENNTGENITKLVECVVDNINDYDGIIVAHGTDTLQYSSCALSYALGADTIPVVLVSANYPLEDSRSNGNDNFSAAVHFIEQKGGRGVFAAYKNSDGICYIHRGSRVMAHFEFSDDLFSVKNQYFGMMKKDCFIKNAHYKSAADEAAPFGKVKLKKHSDIRIINAAVGESYNYNENKIYLIKAYHSGTLPTDDEAFLHFVKSGRQIFISGFDKSSVYESAVLYDMLEINMLPVASFISSYVKLWFAESSGLQLNYIMHKSIGEDILR